MFAERDVYRCFPNNDAQPKLIDLLDELGYPVERTVKVYRQHWRFETAEEGSAAGEFRRAAGSIEKGRAAVGVGAIDRWGLSVAAHDEFSVLDEFRAELLVHCYRMLGSAEEAEDVVQETYLRAWRSYAGFEGRSSARTWLYRIATNACLSAIDRRGRRPLPSGLGGPSDESAEPVPGRPRCRGCGRCRTRCSRPSTLTRPR